MINLNVKNTGTEPVYFTYYTPLHWLEYFTLTDEHKVTKSNPLILKPGNTKVTNKCTFISVHSFLS